MPNLTVIVQCDDKGQYAVGPETEEQPGQPEDEKAEDQALEPAKDLDDALAKAKQLFLQQDQSEDAGDGGSDEGAEGDDAFKAGFSNVAGPAKGGGGY